MHLETVFTSNTAVYSTNAITYFDGYRSLAAYGSGRVRAEYVYSDDSLQAEYMESDEWQKQSAKLRYDRQTDTCYLRFCHVGTRRVVGRSREPNSFGVDCNVDGYLAVASAGAFIGNADPLNHRRRECDRRHARLQQQGTRSAHLTIQSIGDTFANWSEDFYTPSVETTGRKVVSQSCSVTCQKCGKELRADYNAARNIAHRYVKNRRRSGPGRATNHSPSSRER